MSLTKDDHRHFGILGAYGYCNGLRKCVIFQMISNLFTMARPQDDAQQIGIEDICVCVVLRFDNATLDLVTNCMRNMKTRIIARSIIIGY